jgi:uncharacterized protein (DUF433 family)
MPGTNDLLEQFLELPPDRRETLAMHLFEMLPFPFHPLFLKYRLADFPSVISTPNVCGGSPRLVRTRIPVWLLQHMRRLGLSDAKILECYPTLTAGDLAQAWGYAAAHKAEIDKEIEENEMY